MKVRSLKYLAIEGTKNVWANRLMSVASIGVLFACMLIIGFAVLVSDNLNKIVENIGKQNVIMAFFADELDEPTCLARIDDIKNLDNVEEAIYISKDEGLEKMKISMGQDYADALKAFEGDDANILPSAVMISFKDVSVEAYDSATEEVRAVPGISEINTRKDLTLKIDKIRTLVTTASYWVIALLMIVALVIICNTIRITMYSRKLEISIMKAVGATNSFIRIPFIIEGIIIGLVSAAFTIVVVRFMYPPIATMLMEQVPKESILPFRYFFPKLLIMFSSLGVLSGLVSSFMMIGKYLKKEGSEFRAL